MSIRTGSEEVGDEQIEEYPLPEQIEQLIEAGKYSNVENRVTKVCVEWGAYAKALFKRSRMALVSAS